MRCQDRGGLLLLERRLSGVRLLADRTDTTGERNARYELPTEKRRLLRKSTSGLIRLYGNLASHLVKALHQLGVSAI